MVWQCFPGHAGGPMGNMAPSSTEQKLADLDGDVDALKSLCSLWQFLLDFIRMDEETLEIRPRSLDLIEQLVVVCDTVQALVPAHDARCLALQLFCALASDAVWLSKCNAEAVGNHTLHTKNQPWKTHKSSLHSQPEQRFGHPVTASLLHQQLTHSNQPHDTAPSLQQMKELH